MKKKIMLGTLVVFFLLVLIVGIFLLVQLKQLRPEYRDNYQIKELEQPVKISWDQNGVIHIEGESIADVILASGYVTAKERLWQMEVMRRIAKGRLSEIFGYPALNIDKLFLALGLDSITNRNYQQISAESRDWLSWYATGINAYLSEVGNNLPIEFILMKIKPAIWSPEDCLLQNRLMAWFLNFNWKADFLYWQLSSLISPEKIREILPQWNGYPDIIPESGLRKSLKGILETSEQLQQMVGLGSGITGSNSWVVSPFKTANNKAWLANDPHLSLQLPAIWIELQIKAGEFDVMGFAFPGSPGIIIGRNKSLAWGLTNAMIDDSDLFLEKVDTLKGIYWKENISYPLHKREFVIKIKDQPDVIHTCYGTENGPLINLLFPEIETTQAVSLKWVGWEYSDELFTFISLAAANDRKAFESSLQTYAVPAQNFVIADREGNIGYRLGGKIPIRSYENGLLPRPGWDSKNFWRSWIPFNEMPKLFNPAAGFIVTANNRIISNYPYYLSELWESPFRAMRLQELLESNALLDFKAMKEFQFDDKNLLAREIWPIILSELDSVSITHKSAEKIREILKNWDFSMDRENIAAALFETILYFTKMNIFKDEMGEEIFKLGSSLPHFYLRIFLQVIKDDSSSWFDNINTEESETRSTLIRSSILESLQWLEEKCGVDIEDWRWGQLQQLELKHSLGQSALTDPLFNRGPFAVAGSGCTVNAAVYHPDKPFEVFVGPSLRFLVNWGSPEQYWSILPGGNSGHFLSQYYDNQLNDWKKGNLKVVKVNIWEKARVIILSPSALFTAP